MIQVLHVSAECYPAAKTGGLADVVGSLPKYFTAAGMLSGAVIPKYALKWIHSRKWVGVYSGSVWVNWRQWNFTVQQEAGNHLGYPLFVVDIPGLYDRPGIYNDPDGAPYGDELERYITFQQAVLDWLLSFPWQERPRVLHCHDHHTALIPWMVKYCPAYQQLAPIPTVFTIHNGQYQGAFGWNNGNLLPPYEAGARGYLDWNGIINPMAAAIKTAWAVTTVSETYLYELHQNSLGLESLFRDEWRKQWGIINGIDAHVWDPETDPMIQHRLQKGNIKEFKARNKAVLCEWFGFSPDLPLVSFIGRLVGEKGVDLLPDTYRRSIYNGVQANYLVLGTGEPWTQNQFRALAHQFQGRINAVIDYNEALSHQIYAGSDFLIMPSRVEPCGLNQMYAMRYGTIPIVRAIGGLKDTVPDIAEPGGTGRGIRFDQFSVEDAAHAIYRAASMWHLEPGIVALLRERIMAVDFSWERTISKYREVYQKVGADISPLPLPETLAKAAVQPDAKKARVTPKPAAKKALPKSTEDKGTATDKTKPAPRRKASPKPPPVKPALAVKKKKAGKASTPEEKPPVTGPAPNPAEKKKK
ncbi:MAG: glycogen/starch synthase [Saprospiraceae bacterium]|nr:glycogen/starch synthase [Saprospiraceae bacterium]